MLLDARSYPMQRILEQHLEPKNLAYAMRLWSTHYITQPNISLQRFVDDFYSRQPMSISSYGLYSDLLPAMMSSLQARSEFNGEPIDGYELPDYDLGGPSTTNHPPSAAAVPAAAPIPSAIPAVDNQPISPITEPEPIVQTPVPPAPVAAPSQPPSRPRDERFVIFSSFIRQLLNGISPERREKMLYRSRLDLKATCHTDVSELFYAWLQTDSDYFQHHSLDVKAMSAITHVIYMGLCEYQGPVDADRILMKVAESINDTYPFGSLDINQLL